MIAEGENPDAPLDGYRIVGSDIVASPMPRPKGKLAAAIDAPKKSA